MNWLGSKTAQDKLQLKCLCIYNFPKKKKKFCNDQCTVNKGHKSMNQRLQEHLRQWEHKYTVQLYSLDAKIQ